MTGTGDPPPRSAPGGEPPAGERERRLEQLLQACFLARDEGREPDVAALCRDAPELLPDLRRLLEREGRLRRAFASLDPEPEPAATLPLERVGEFRLLRRLGEGGMGRVFLAVQESLGRRVAVKILRAPAGSDPVAERRFRREAEITASLDHPNIVPVFAVGEEGGFAWIAMKRLASPSLDHLAEPLAPREAARIGAAIARALHEAHLAGVIHRDVKPGNVVVDQGTPYILDFGLARSPDGVSMTREGAVPGTLLYMSPEQLRADGVVLDARTDVYSLGATLYEAVAGRPPFAGAAPEAIIRQILLREPAPLRLAAEDRDLATLVGRAMEKERDRRFASAAELADELDRFVAGEAIHTRPPGLVSRMWRLGRRHRRTALVLAALLLLLLVSGGLLLVGNVREARLLRETRTKVRAALDRDDYDEARAFLSTWLGSYPRNADLLALRREAAGLEALAALLDHIQGTPFAEAGRVRRRLEALEAAGGAGLRPPLAEMAAAIAHVLAGAGPRADALLRDLEVREGPSRALGALRDLARGVDPALRLAASEPPAPEPGLTPVALRLRADECLFAALALRMVHAGPEAREREIDAALRLVPDHYRALFEKARLHAERGDHATAAAVFQGMVNRGRRRPVVLTGLARELMLIGAVRRAEAALEEAARGREPKVGIEHVRLQLLQRRGRREEFLAALARARERWPDDLELVLFEGQRLAAEAGSARDEAARRRALEAAEAAFRDVVARAGWPSIVQAAESALLQLEFRELPGAEALSPLPLRATERREELADLAERARDLAARAVGPVVRGQARLLQAMALWLLDRRAESWAALDAALAADARSPAAHLRFALQTVARLQADPDEDVEPGAVDAPPRLPFLVPRARAHAARVRALRGRGESPPTPSELEWALRLDAILALHEHDRDGCRRAVAALEEGFESGAFPVDPGDLEELEVLRRRCAPADR